MNDTYLMWDIVLFQNCSKCNFKTKKELLSEEQKEEIEFFLGSCFIFHSPIYWFFFPPKNLSFCFSSVNVCVGASHWITAHFFLSLFIISFHSTHFVVRQTSWYTPPTSPLHAARILSEHNRQKCQLSNDIYTLFSLQAAPVTSIKSLFYRKETYSMYRLGAGWYPAWIWIQSFP